MKTAMRTLTGKTSEHWLNTIELVTRSSEAKKLYIHLRCRKMDYENMAR